MSDLYVELKSRIPVVSARTAVGRERLQSAQDAVGLSNERLARLIPVSEKTWRRWKEAGEVPTYALPQVAKALRLELVEAPARLDLLDGDGDRSPETMPPLQLLQAGVESLLEGNQEALMTQREILERISALEEMLGAKQSRQPARRSRR